MPMKNNSVRYAHTDGHTDLCYSEEGKYILTCGNDGDIRVWLGLEDDDPTSHCVGENALALVQKGSKLYVGTDDNTLRCYKFPEMERDGVLSRFSQPITHISISPDGNTLAAASQNSEIYVRDMKNQKHKTLTGHTGPVLCVAIDPKCEYLASSSGDGQVCVWELGSARVVQSWTGVPTCSSFFEAKVLCRVCWQSGTGQTLAVPRGRCVLLYERGTWQQLHLFSHLALDKDLSISSFSSCGKYLAASSTVGDIVAWDVSSRSCVGITKSDKKLQICALAWNPSGNGEIAFCDFSGQLGTVTGCILDDSKICDELVSHELGNNAGALANGVMDSDDDEENTISLEKIKSEVAVPVTDDALDTASLAGRSEDDDVHSERVFMSELQPPFQPTATPSHLQHRFMVWNAVGIVRCSSTPEEVIDVEFHDTSTHHALHMRNMQRYSMASLTQHALLLACECETDLPSKVTCVLLNCWDGTREWSVELPEGEGALCVAAGSDWVGVATDARLLRLWTLSGAQREVVALPGPALCLAAHDHALLLVCHIGPGVSGDQSLSYSEMNTQQGRVSAWQPLPLAPRTMLQWLGYSDEGSPCLHDSSGSLRLLTARGYWLPILQTASLVKGKSDHYFVLGVSEGQQNARAVLCRGARYPPTTPRPPVLEISFKVALADVSSDRGQLEEEFWRCRLAAPAVAATVQEGLLSRSKETCIKLFAMACRAEQQARALELCALVADPQVWQLAVKYASKLGKSQLADRISSLELLPSCDPLHLPSSFSEQLLKNEPYRRSPASRAMLREDQDAASANGVNNPCTPLEERSLIVEAAKVQRAVEVVVPVLTSSQVRANPFKKSDNHLQPGRGLDTLATLPTKNTTAAKSTATKAGVPVFVEWYREQESSLREQFPHLSAQQLTREAMRHYKQLTQGGDGTAKREAASDADDQHGNKRKLPEDEEKPPVKKPATASSKLTAYLFKKC